jgi:hypothetical protein
MNKVLFDGNLAQRRRRHRSFAIDDEMLSAVGGLTRFRHQHFWRYRFPDLFLGIEHGIGRT